MEPFGRLRSRTVVLPATDIDTDQIIPARYLTTTSRTGLGRHLFAGWRYTTDGAPQPGFALNRPEAAGCAILVAGRNFGCGSSREHAAWALYDYGIRVVISSEIADIFRSNALKNGLLPMVVDAGLHAWLLAHPGAELEVDLDACRLRLPDGRELPFTLESFARHCLLHGVDELGHLLAQTPAIEAFERQNGR
ncbi:MAG: 3-isopropylmalate dehydratase small subunit [Gammaproteobacteria bacterium]|nr:3-isopropylmalate dehydratase small subunit [Gammaproteobacteria bacterium]